MATYTVRPEPATLRGYLSRDLAPILTVEPGDSVRYQTLDAAWGAVEQEADFAEPRAFDPRDTQRDAGHALCGPVALRGAEPGMAIEVFLRRIRTGRWGWSAGPALPSQLDKRLGLPGAADGPPKVIMLPRGDAATYWTLDPDQNIGTSQDGRCLRLRPFPGYIGLTPNEPGILSTFPPRACGGNLDCKELVEGSSLFMPVALPGGQFWIGDGHAVQGDGEIAGPALACPLEEVDVEFRLHPELRLASARARTPSAWITFGFHHDLNEAAAQAAIEMVALMRELHGLETKEALGLAGLVADLRITQMVNGVRGVHAVLPHEALGPV
jgi:acetamidase/formamidase